MHIYFLDANFEQVEIPMQTKQLLNTSCFKHRGRMANDTKLYTVLFDLRECSI